MLACYNFFYFIHLYSAVNHWATVLPIPMCMREGKLSGISRGGYNGPFIWRSGRGGPKYFWKKRGHTHCTRATFSIIRSTRAKNFANCAIKRGIGRDTIYQCEASPNKPGLCVTGCFTIIICHWNLNHFMILDCLLFTLTYSTQPTYSLLINWNKFWSSEIIKNHGIHLWSTTADTS